MAALITSTPTTGHVNVTLAWATAPRSVVELALTMPVGATVADALNQMDASMQASAGLGASSPIGVWGKKADLTQLLQDRDRVEIYRPLLVDPKTARRERFNQQGTGKAGLFAQRRRGAKAGY